MQATYFTDADGELYRLLPCGVFEKERPTDGHWVKSDPPDGELDVLTADEAQSIREGV